MTMRFVVLSSPAVAIDDAEATLVTLAVRARIPPSAMALATGRGEARATGLDFFFPQ